MKHWAVLILALFCGFVISFDTTLMAACSGSCISGCRSCNNTACVSCQPGYILNNASNTCTSNPCSIPDCDACDSNGSCIRCTDPYSVFKASTSTCIQSCSITNCAKCRSGSTSCLACNSGFSLYSLNSQCISSVISNCLVLHDFRRQQFQCTLCASGFRPSLDQTQCISAACLAIHDCQECSVATACDKCRIGYSYNNGKCLANSCNVANCLYCNTSNVCLRCKSNYTLSANQCVAKSCALSYCQICKPGSIFCDSCQEGYNINIWTKVCEGSNPKLRYLWFLTLLLTPVIVVIVICFVKKGKLVGDVANETMDSKIEDTKAETKDIFDTSNQRIQIQKLPDSKQQFENTNKPDEILQTKSP